MMNERQYLNAILNLNLSDELKEETEGRLAKLDARNEKRKATQTKTQKENEPIAKAILEALEGGAMLSTALAQAIGQSTNKTNGVAGNLVNEGLLVKTKVKVKGKGEQTQYSLVVEVSSNEDADAEEEAED